MKDEITEFFGNIENITDFSISKQIRKQTNNLDPNEFCKLSLEYKNYCRSRVFHEQMLPKKTDEVSKVLEEITKNDPDFLKILPVKYYAFENGKIQQKVGSINPNPRFNFNCKYLYYEFENFQNIMHELFEIIKSKETTETAQPQQNEIVKNDEKYKTQNLFKVGLLFATGEMNKYFTVIGENKTVMNKEYSSPIIAKELKNSSFEKIILATINNYKTAGNKSKNIFNNKGMMNDIIDHCKAKNIPVIPYFISRLPIE
jgi:hypothetical protein